MQGSAWLCIAMHWLCSSVMLGYHQMMNDEAYLIKRQSKDNQGKRTDKISTQI